jgi:lysophospholipase L1-like esterase
MHFRLIFAFGIAACFAVPAPALADTPTCDLAQFAQLQQQTAPNGYANPDLMAIGDSAYNGVESLSISKEKAYYSVPAFVARGLKIQTFRIPQYERPVLVDLDRDLEASWLHVAETLETHVANDVNAYASPTRVTYFQHAMPKFFDNIAVAQADSANLICDTAGRASTWISGQYKGATQVSFASGGGITADNLVDWFYNVNSRFLLNPSLDNQYMNLSQLGEVVLRKPKKLLINIGANDGVWLMAFEGFTPGTCYALPAYTPAPCGAGINKVSNDIAQLVINMKTIAQVLKPLNTRIYVNLLAAPRAIANLNPVGNARLASDPKYYDKYQTFLNEQDIRTISGADVKAMDTLISQTNSQIVSAMCSVLGPQRVSFVDLFGLLTKYDAKNAPNSHPNKDNSIPVKIVLGDGPKPVPFDNLVLHSDPKRYAVTGGEFGLIEGGLFSLDSMHPTAFGYALLSNMVMAAVQAPTPAGHGCAVFGPNFAQTIDYSQLYAELVAKSVPNSVFEAPHTRDLLLAARVYVQHEAKVQAQGGAPAAVSSDEAAFKQVKPLLSLGNPSKAAR